MLYQIGIFEILDLKSVGFAIIIYRFTNNFKDTVNETEMQIKNFNLNLLIKPIFPIGILEIFTIYKFNIRLLTS